MRSLDNWTTYDDTWGKPFQGKFTFCKLGTSELISITDVNGTRLPNPMLSDMHGRTEHQVFLPDEDVTVVMHKWIGPGSMAEADTDDSHWTLVRSFDNLTEVSQITINDQVVEAIRVSTKESLQTMVVPEGVEYAILSGYYEAGDMPPANYKLVYNPDLIDDGGSIIQSCGNPDITNAFWVLIPEQVIDCRIFGVFPKNSYNNPTSYTSQLAHCFVYANSMGREVYMPQVYQNTNNGNTFSYYWLEGGSFVLQTCLNVDKNVRICLKTGTTNSMTLYALKHEGESNIFTNNGGSGSLTLDVRGEMCASWFNPSWATFPGSVRKVILDTRSNPFTFKNTIVEVQKLQNNKTFNFEDCYIEADKKFRNCTLNFTRCGFVSDRWLDTGNTVTLIGNQIRLSNMSSANAYIEWKNKQNESDYGDLGEQSINASVRPGGTIENCYGSITLLSHGSFEFHNVSLTVTGLEASDSINAVDSWFTINGSSVVSSLQIRRGSIAGSAVQVLSSVLLDNVDMNVQLTTLGAATEIRNSRIYSYVTATNIILTNNQIYREINQRDVDGVITINCVGNMFHMTGGSANIPARHYVHSYTPNTVVNGIWANNGSSYDTIHWIRLDRTNLKVNDIDHSYTYSGNSEPYLKKWSGSNRPMFFKLYGGYRYDGSRGEGVFSTTATPFIFLNYRTREISVVPRQIYWKMFTVGRTAICRSGHLSCPADLWSGYTLCIGITEGDYSDRTNGTVHPILDWGTYFQNTPAPGYSALMCICRDGTGEANYEYSFEAQNADHSSYGYGVSIGNYPSKQWNTYSTDADEERYATYPNTPKTGMLCVHIDPDFSTAVNAQNPF